MPADYRTQSHSTETGIHPVTRTEVSEAKKLMREGYSMSDAAMALDVLEADLDRNLFRWLGIGPEAIAAPVPRRVA